MNANFFGDGSLHLIGDSSCHAMARRWRQVAALLLLAGASSLRRTGALPGTPSAAFPGVSNWRL